MRSLILFVILGTFVMKASAFSHKHHLTVIESDTIDVFRESLLKQFESDCEPNIVLTAIEGNNTHLYWAANSIRVQNNYRIIGNLGSDITMKAGEVIVLGPKTAVLKGNRYLARIEPCIPPGQPCPPADVVFIPKGISPNGDGDNDTFDLTGQCVEMITIFNRYGLSVFEADNYTDQWHGQSNGGMLPVGTYFYTLTLSAGERMTGWIYLQY